MNDKSSLTKIVTHPPIYGLGASFLAVQGLHKAGYKVATDHFQEFRRGDLVFQAALQPNLASRELNAFADLLEERFLGDAAIKDIIQDATEEKSRWNFSAMRNFTREISKDVLLASDLKAASATNEALPCKHSTERLSIRIKTTFSKPTTIAVGKDPRRLKMTLGKNDASAASAALHVIDYWRKHDRRFPEQAWQQENGCEIVDKSADAPGKATSLLRIIGRRLPYNERMYALELEELTLRRELVQRFAIWEQAGPAVDRTVERVWPEFDRADAAQALKIAIAEEWKKEATESNTAAKILKRDMRYPLLENLGIYQRPSNVDMTIAFTKKLMRWSDPMQKFETLIEDLPTTGNGGHNFCSEDRLLLAEGLYESIVADGLRLSNNSDGSDQSPSFPTEPGKELYARYRVADQRLRDSLKDEHRAINDINNADGLIDADDRESDQSSLFRKITLFRKTSPFSPSPSTQLKTSVAKHKDYIAYRRHESERSLK